MGMKLTAQILPYRRNAPEPEPTAFEKSKRNGLFRKLCLSLYSISSNWNDNWEDLYPFQLDIFDLYRKTAVWASTHAKIGIIAQKLEYRQSFIHLKYAFEEFAQDYNGKFKNNYPFHKNFRELFPEVRAWADSCLANDRGRQAQILPYRAHIPTLDEFLDKEFDEHFSNFGDVNYMDYGGVQFKYDKTSKEFIIYELMTPDHGVDGYMITALTLDPSQFFEEDDAFDKKINELTPTLKAKEVQKFSSSGEWNTGSSKHLKHWLLDVIMGYGSYHGYDDDETYKIKDMDNDEEVKAVENEVEHRLHELNFDL
jgi:hypothetical protein